MNTPGVLTLESGSCSHWIPVPRLGGVGLKSLHVGSLISYKAHAFLPCVIGRTVELAIFQGVGLPVRVPSGLLEAWVQVEWCWTCLSSICKINRPSLGQFPGPDATHVVIFLESVFLTSNYGSFRNSSFHFTVDSWFFSDLFFFLASQLMWAIRWASGWIQDGNSDQRKKRTLKLWVYVKNQNQQKYFSVY